MELSIGRFSMRLRLFFTRKPKDNDGEVCPTFLGIPKLYLHGGLPYILGQTSTPLNPFIYKAFSVFDFNKK